MDLSSPAEDENLLSTSRRGSHRQSRLFSSELEYFNRGSSEENESLLSTSRRGSHRQSRNQVSPQEGEEEEVECLNFKEKFGCLDSKGGSGRQSRMFSPDLENFNRESPQENESLLSTSRRGSHRQSRNQVSPQEEEICKGESGRQSRVLSPQLEHVNRKESNELPICGKQFSKVDFLFAKISVTEGYAKASRISLILCQRS